MGEEEDEDLIMIVMIMGVQEEIFFDKSLIQVGERMQRREEATASSTSVSVGNCVCQSRTELVGHFLIAMSFLKFICLFVLLFCIFCVVFLPPLVLHWSVIPETISTWSGENFPMHDSYL